MANSKPLIVNNGTTEQFPATPGDTLEVAGNLDVTSGQVAIPDGTAAAPAIAFRDDLNNGIFSPGTDQLAISTAGTQRMVVDATGQVGIGTATPAYAIDAIGSIYATDTAPYVWSQTTSNSNQAQVGASAPGGIYLQMRAAGSAFAGTFLGSSDANWTAINPNNVAGNGLKIGVNASGQQFLLGSYEPGTSNSAVRLTLNNDEAIFNAPGHDFDFRVEGTTDANALVVDASANAVGIGTSTPAYKLDVAANTAGGVARFSNANATGFAAVDFTLAGTQRFSFGYAGAAFGLLQNNAYFYSQNSDLMIMVQDVAATANRPSVTFKSAETVFNDNFQNIDFRVESVANANMLLVDASANTVSVGTTGNTHTFNVGTGASANFCVADGGFIHTYGGGPPNDGELLIGHGVNGRFQKNTLTAGTGIAITNGAGTISIAASNAGGVQPITTISSNTTLGGTNYTVLCNGGLTVSLPAAASNTGRVYNIKKIDAGGLGLDTIIDPNGAETIDGAATYTLTTQYESVTIQCNGTAWFIL